MILKLIIYYFIYSFFAQEKMITQNQSQLSIQMFTDKMILSTSKNHKDILLWAENSGTIAFTYTDDNLRTYIPNNKLQILDNNLYSEYFIYLHENKSLFTIWNTDNTKFYFKFSITDERITTFDTYDNILLVGTINGLIYIYNLMTGQLIKSITITTSQIYSIKLYHNFIFVLDKDKLSSFLYGELLQGTNDTTPKELYVYYNKENIPLDNFVINNNIGLLSNRNKIILLSLNDLTPIKIFNVDNQEIFNLVLSMDDNSLYFTNNKNDIFRIINNNYAIHETHHIIINKEHSILIEPDVKNKLGNITLFTFGSKDNLLTGHEDGKICLWAKKNKNTILYTNNNMFNIHKGPITNIILINKPISQYGLNFNKKITECIINDKQIKELGEIKIKGNETYQNYLDNYIEDYNNIINQNNIIDICMNDGDNLTEKINTSKNIKKKK